MNILIYRNHYNNIRLIVKLFKKNYNKVLLCVYYLNYGSGVINLKVQAQ